MTEPHQLDAATIATRVAAGTLSVADVAESLIARVDARDADVRAWAWFDRDLLRDRASLLDEVPIKGPLHGVPIAVKDVIATYDMPTAHNTPRYRNSRTGVDAACVDTLRAAGALIAGKTVTTEFAATLRGGSTRNPHALTHTPGGSSSGSAAAVADWQATLGLGTQTGGSTIRPASFCGIYGWKPTWSSISREGLKMSSTTLDTLGLYARSARDLMLLADVFAIDALEMPAPASLAGLKVGICRTPHWGKALPATVHAMSQAVALLRQVGAEVTELDLPGIFDTIGESHRIVARTEGRAAFLNEYRNTYDLHDDFKATVENRSGITPGDARAAYRHADHCRGLYDDIASAFDIVLTPSATGEAPEGHDITGDASFNSMWTLLQVPVVNVPGLVGPGGLPVGLSLVGRRYEDRKALAIAELVGAMFNQRDAAAA
ncbi:amidase [Devosia beringensis]|uniref:amidase n=1 Tax=Devosia beringensis TaxID=2657486 RepID=UPI00186B5B62|nr:amidase [Devosia beringensis]